jgi:hypothetical protein
MVAGSRTQWAMAINYAKFFSRSHDGVIRVYDEAGNVIETHEQAGHFKTFEPAPQFPSSAHAASGDIGPAREVQLQNA